MKIDTGLDNISIDTPIRVRAKAGSSYWSAKRDAMIFALQSECDVEFEFNGERILVSYVNILKSKFDNL
jgi:hypothetical protein